MEKLTAHWSRKNTYGFAAKNHNPTYPGQILHVRFCMRGPEKPNVYPINGGTTL